MIINFIHSISAPLPHPSTAHYLCVSLRSPENILNQLPGVGDSRRMQGQFSLWLVTVYSRCSRQQSKGRDVERHRLEGQRCGGKLNKRERASQACLHA